MHTKSFLKINKLANLFLIVSYILFLIAMSLDPWQTINDPFAKNYFGSVCFPWNYKTPELYFWTYLPDLVLFWGIFILAFLMSRSYPKLSKFLWAIPLLLLLSGFISSIITGGNDCG